MRRKVNSREIKVHLEFIFLDWKFSVQARVKRGKGLEFMMKLGHKRITVLASLDLEFGELENQTKLLNEYSPVLMS